MKALLLLVFAILLSAAVLIGAERLGYLMPSQEPEAYAARLTIAEEITSKWLNESYGPYSRIAKSLDKAISVLEQKHPEIVASNRPEVNRIYDLWRVKSLDFAREAFAHFMARHLTTVALERMRDGRQPIFPDVRKFVVLQMRKDELDLVVDRTKHFPRCSIFVDVLPALAALGMAEFDRFVEQKENCELLISVGLFDPKNAILKSSDLKQ